MLKTFKKFYFMIKLGYKYIPIFKNLYLHPYITLQSKLKQLSQKRQEYSNSVLDLLNLDIKLIGEFPKQNNVIYTINHRSLLDIIVMEYLFSKHNKAGTWIAKQELFDAFYGDFFKHSGIIGIDLENKKGLLKFFKEIKNIFSNVNDFNLYIFPEGERNKTDELLKFQSGASKIAKANNLKVVPVYIEEQLEKVFQEAPFKEKKTIHVYVGDFISEKNLEQEYKEFVKQRLKNGNSITR